MAKLALLGFALGLALAACRGAKQCDAAACGGCCDAHGECRAGGLALACGGGGEQCRACGAGEQCVARQCHALGPLDGGEVDAAPDGGGGPAPDGGGGPA